MKKAFYLLAFSMILFSCNKEKKISHDILSIPLEAKISRFDQDFITAKPESLQQLKSEYPFLLTENVPDSIWLNKKTDSLFNELYKETQLKFKDLSALQKELTLLFKHIKYYYPKENPGKVVTVLSDVDITNRTIYADSISIISLDTYLGKNHKFYQNFDSYTLGDFEPNRIVVDLAENFATQKIASSQDRLFISNMIYWGKIMYFKETLLPEVSNALKMNYTQEQLTWVEENEAQIWKYFVENKYLYNNEVKLTARFIQRAPFSKFYLGLDQESPGSVGVFIGWQIVRSYMKNNNVTLQELAVKDAKTIFDQSKYKPKK